MPDRQLIDAALALRGQRVAQSQGDGLERLAEAIEASVDTNRALLQTLSALVERLEMKAPAVNVAAPPAAAVTVKPAIKAPAVPVKVENEIIEKPLPKKVTIQHSPAAGGGTSTIKFEQ